MRWGKGMGERDDISGCMGLIARFFAFPDAGVLGRRDREGIGADVGRLRVMVMGDV